MPMPFLNNLAYLLTLLAIFVSSSVNTSVILKKYQFCPNLAILIFMNFIVYVRG